MSSTVVSSVYVVCSDAAGIAGNIFAFVLFLSPIPTFRRIIRNESTEMFSGMPYIYALLNCLICLWYGMPIVSPGIILMATVNSIGAIFQLIYISVFVVYAEKPMKVPNGIGTGLETLQLALYAYFNDASQEELKHPLIDP
ncbi:hypothetical protein PVK06_015070 [Gossypium arboreum]|uniref:Uncharacterized protein n=1 Tax=Gossypium arboreum TaxID=29729 RepID=A0ABR0PWE4_GOSAR|nr:hypothetical protein PVK06_015070 [Gossypium arboreum]